MAKRSVTVEWSNGGLHGQRFAVIADRVAGDVSARNVVLSRHSFMQDAFAEAQRVLTVALRAVTSEEIVL